MRLFICTLNFINAIFYVIYRSRNNEPGIEMKVMHEGEEVDIGASVDKAINEISAENSMVSIDNVNSIIGKALYYLQFQI